MKIEVLFPEICNLYGELANITYLEKSYPEAEVIRTAVNDEPYFATGDPDLIYMGTMTESSQLIVLEKLRPYKERIEQLIDGGTNFLITGNALEIFGKTIEDTDGTVVECLGVFDVTAKRDMMNRFNSLYLGKFNEDAQDGDQMEIVGFKSQFTHSYWNDGTERSHLFKTERGPGLNPDTADEGIRRNNFMATYVIGPLLILNPRFAMYVLRLCGADDPVPAFKEAAEDAYQARVKEYSDPSTGIYY